MTDKNQEVDEALDALSFICRTIGWLEVVPPYGDKVNRTKEADKAIDLCKTIRAALEAKVPDGYVLVPIDLLRKAKVLINFHVKRGACIDIDDRPYNDGDIYAELNSLWIAAQEEKTK